MVIPQDHKSWAFNKVVIITAFDCRLLSVAFSCCCFGVAFVCRFGALFICVMVIQTSKIYLISNNKSNQWSSICCRTEIIGILVTIVILNV